MQNRRDFLTTATLLPTLAIVGSAPFAVMASTAPQTSENDLIARLDPSIWISWGKIDFPNAEGATDKNLSGYLQVGFQYHTFTLLPYALIHRNTHFLDGICSMAEYAFRHQNPDGSFEYRESNGTVSSGTAPNPESPPSSLTLFFYDLGHSLLVLKNDAWYSESAECASYRSRLTALTAKIEISLTWLLAQRTLLATDRATSNRTMAHGLAYYFIGKYLGRSEAITVGKSIVLAALDAQSDGVFPEDGGFDSSYQTIDILEVAWMMLHVGNDVPFRERLWSAMESGVARERRSVLPSGEVLTKGNTRVFTGGETFFGRRKIVNGREVMLAFAYYGSLAGDQSSLDLVPHIQSFYNLATK